MKKLLKWHKNIYYKWLEKSNITSYQAAWLSWLKGFLMGLLFLLLCGCGVQFQYGVLNNAGYADGIYRQSNDITLEIPEDTNIDTITSFSQLRYKLRTDFNFRWDFAQYAMNQPLSWYYNNPRLNGIWRPYNRFDVYFYSNWFWSDWAFNYPFHHYWGWNNWYNWNRPYYYYGWNRPYNPWNNWYQIPFVNQGYSTVWNTSRRNNVAYINGPRGSRNIENTINNNRRVRTYPNNNMNRIVNNIKENINNNNNVRIYSKPNNINIIPNNNTRPRINNNSRPIYNSRPVINNTTRSSNSNTVRINSRRKN